MEEKKYPEDNKHTEQPQESSDFEFIKEQIKDRPINKKKLAKRMFITAGMAVMFSLIACLSFLLLEPVLSDILNPEEEIPLNPVTLPEVAEEDESPVTIDPIIVETPIEDMSLTDEDVDAAGEQNQGTADIPGVSTNAVSENSAPAGEQQEIELSDYQLLYRKLYALSNEVSTRLVTVTGLT